ncbi:hypothetical protein [Anaerosinus gibii]|uniref:Uncharacterized protein n=1 Tax=Selenobaculum gibii TaxID=3054208 RepID=A0A9Y2ESL3_9FIRM|nr:hypothetical protein [Selenobaculum gbiensis]WIW70471.1 hypothetical protein P3F81_11390 [Selenobaculum gbiensis]
MSTMVTAELKAGIIYGDMENNEYVYMPASEIGVENPICVIETPTDRKDISLKDAVNLIRKLSLKPAKHPRLGKQSC